MSNSIIKGLGVFATSIYFMFKVNGNNNIVSEPPNENHIINLPDLSHFNIANEHHIINLPDLPHFNIANEHHIINLPDLPYWLRNLTQDADEYIAEIAIRTAYYHGKFKKRFLALLHWVRRKNYLLLLEGTKEGMTHYYIMNEYVGRDIMSYL
jgi:hypothetical protein